MRQRDTDSETTDRLTETQTVRQRDTDRQRNTVTERTHRDRPQTGQRDTDRHKDTTLLYLLGLANCFSD